MALATINNLSLSVLECQMLLGINVSQNSSKNETAKNPVSSAEIWGIGFLFVTVISFSAAGGICLLPLLKRRLYYQLLTYFVGLGVGSLSGTAIFHLLPSAFDVTDVHYLEKAWLAIGGIYLFFMVDRFMKLVMEIKKRRKLRKSKRRRQGDTKTYKVHAHDHSSHMDKAPTASVRNAPPDIVSAGDHETSSTPFTQAVTSDPSSSCLVVMGSNGTGTTANGLSAMGDTGPGSASMSELSEKSGSTNSMAGAALSAQTDKMTHAMCAHDHDIHFKQGDSVIAAVAWMIIFGDGLHNFIDGLSIGASFSQDIVGGISVSVAVLCEEFPHELGDVAILLSAGMSWKQALVYNLLSAFTCYLGFIIGVLVGELADASIYIFALAGGMFLYISLATMIPEMNSTFESALNIGFKKAAQVFVLQGLGLLTGLLIMYLLSRFGEDIKF